MRSIFLNIVKYKLITFEHFFKKSAVVRVCSLFIFSFIFQNNILAQNANITISTGTETGVSWTGAGTDASPWVLVPTAQSVTINITNLKAKLANSNVTINTAYASGTTGPTIGTVTFSNELIDSSSSSTTKTLTINANSDIIINANIIMSTNYNTNNHTYLPKALNFTSTNGSISVNAIIKTIPSNLLAANGLDRTGMTAGAVTLTTNGTSGAIKVLSAGQILTNGQYNASTTTNSWGGNGGNISLISIGSSGGVSVAGKISTSAGKRANGGDVDFKFSEPGKYNITTNNTAVTAGINDGQVNTTVDSIGSFTKDGAGIYQIKRTVFGGTADIGYDKLSPSFKILNGTIKLVGSANAHFSDFADFDIASTGTLELNGISETIGSITGAGKINTVSTPATAHTLTLTYSNPFKTQLIATTDALKAGLVFSGVITGNLTLIKTYPDFGSIYNQKDEHGTLILTNTSNNYTGKTILRAGRLFVNANALGVNSSISDSVVIEKFGTLLLYGGVQLNKKISIKGNGEFGTGAILDSTGLNKIIGTIKLDSAATIGTISTNINLSTDSLELGAINTSTFELTIRNNLGVHAKGIISGTGTSSLTKTGNQVLKLGGVNDYTGFTKITSGSILLGAADRISSNSDLQLNGGDFNTNNFNETLRKIFILNSGSTITLGNGAVAHNLTFGFSDSAYVANYIKVVNWAGSFLNDGTTGTGGDIIFTKKQINSQLDNFRFEKTGDPVLYKARQINNGANFEIVPGSNTLSNHANINIVTTTTSGTSVSVGGSWTGSGTALSPHTFTLNAESAEIVISEIVSKLQSSDGNSNVLIKTDYTGSNQSGTIFLSGAISANNNITINQNTFTFTAKNTINLNGAITLTSSGYSASTVAYPVTNLNFNADTAINVNANIIASATNMTNYAYKSANGGSVVFNLANNKGVFSLANTISIISAGSNNTHVSAFGGDGGNVSITANGGITINGNINLPNGASLASPTFLNTRPGTLTVATENATITSSGVNDGQNATSTFSIGNFIKNGTGFFKLNNAKWVGGNSTTLKEFNTPYHQINAGRLQLSSNTSISDSASIAINTGAILDLASFGETLGNISGAGLITTSSGTPTLILTSNSVDNTTTTKFSKFEFSGKLSGAFAIQKNGNDTLILSGDNLSSVATPSHSGAFEVRGGVIVAKSNETLGTTSSITTLNGGTVVLDMQGSTISEPFTFANGEGISTEGALKLLSTSTGNTINGAMIVNTNATTRINTNAPLTLSSSVSFNSGAILKLGGTGTITMTSLLSSVAATNGTLQQEIPLLVLSGNSSSFTGNFNNPTSGNTTLLQNANGLGNTGTATIGSGALLKLDGTGFSIAKALNLNGTGISTSGVLWNTGTTNTFTGAVTLANNSTINTDASTTLTMSGAIGGGFGITKIGTGTLSLGGTNGFTGNSTISNGTVVVTNISGLGPTGSTTISNGAMVRISVAGTITEPFSIIGTGIDNAGVIQNTINGTTISGAITLAGNSTINTDASTTLTLSGLIGGTGFGITKIGTGTISLGNANTFTGNNTISNGTAVVTNINGLGGSVVGSSGTTTISDGAMVKISVAGTMPEAFNITGTGVSNVGVIQNTVSGAILSGAITLAGTSMIRTDLSTTLTISNTTDGLNMGANELNIGGNGTIVVSGKLTGSNSTTSIFRKDGIGTLTLSNDNGTSFTGPIVINAGGGILVATHANALGTTGAGTIVNNQSSLQLGVTNIAEPVNIRGHGYGSTTATIATTGALYTSAATFTYKGVLTLDSIATIASVTSGTLTMDAAPGSIVMNDKVLHINGAGNFLINSVITGSATLNKWGAGTTTLSGNNGTSFTGPIVVNAGGGILAATHANALGTTAAGTTVFNQASIQLGVTDISEPISIRGHGNGQTSTVASIGALYTSAASYTYKGVLTVDSTATIASVTSGTLTFDNTTNAIISNNTAGGSGYTINGAGNVSITGKLSGIGSLTKSGIGTTLLSLDNSTGAAYNATTNVNDGILRITDGNALGTSTSNTIVSSTGSVQLENNITVLETFTIASTNANGAIRNQSGKNTLQGLITLSGTASIITHNATTGVLNDSLFITGGINLGANALTLTPNNQGMRISNNLIYGSGTLTKNGADTLVLLNANTYTGNTTVSAGKIILKDKDALGNNGTTYGITTLSGGTVVLDMQSITIAEPFTFASGEGIGNDGALKLIATSTGNTISGAMVVNGSVTTRINTYAPLTISSGLTLNGSATFKLGGTATITMSSIIAAGTGVLQQENPLLVLSGNSSSYTGNFNNPTSGNTTLLQNANGLGSSGTATIGSGALLKIEGTGFSIGKALNLNGTGISTSGVLWNTGTANTFTGAVTLAGNSTINTDANTTLTMTTGAISGTNLGITKIGSGILSLGGTNTFTGNNTISNGTVVVTNINGLGGSGVGSSGTTTVSDGAMIRISVAGTLPEAFNIIGTGISSNGVLQNTVTGAIISGIITLAGNSTINTDASTTLTISGAIGGTGFGITKIGSGNLSLGGTNTFTGDNTISAGAAIVTNANGLGGNVVGSSGTTTVSNNAMVQFLTTGSMSVPEAFNIIGTGVSSVGVLQNSVNGTNLTGAITLAGLSMIRADNGMGLTISNTAGGLDMGANELNIGGAGNITFSGKLTGSNSTTSIFRKDGTGTLTLSNDNGISFTGPTIVNAGGGILAVTHANALGTTTAGTTVFNQASIQLGVTNIAEPINIRGHGYGQASTVATIGALYTSAATFTYKGVLTVDSTATIASVTSGTLTFDNTTDAIISNNTLGGSGYTINGAGNISVTGKLSGIGSLTKSGTGTTLLSLDNSTGTAYTAETYVNNGILRITNGNALGTSSNNTVVSATGSVQLENNITVLETFTITSTNANGAIRNQSGKNTLQGLITLSGAASIITHTTGTALNDSLYITGGINIGANALTLTPNNQGMRISNNAIYGSGTITKNGADTLVLLNANAYTGNTTLSAGKIIIKDKDALGNTGGTYGITTVNAGTTLQIVGNGMNIAEPITLNGDGLATNQGALKNSSQTNIISGAITIGSSGARIVSTGVALDGSDLLTLSGLMTLNGLLTIDVTKGINISNVISGVGGITKIGNDTLIVGGANFYTGATIISNGVLQLQNQDGLGSTSPGGSSTTASTTTVASGAAIKIVGSGFVIPETLSLSGTGYNSRGVIYNQANTNTLSGAITLAGEATFTSDGTNSNDELRVTTTINTSTSTLTINTIKAARISAVISGTGALIKNGSDTLILAGVNTYKGLTSVNKGTLKLGAIDVIDNAADLYLNGGNLTTYYNETIRKLYLTDNSSIILGQTSHTLTFSDVDSLLNKKKLIISGWAGAYTGTGTGANGKIIFTADTLLDYQLDQINFINASGTSFFSTQNLSSSTEIIPIGTEATTITGYSNVFITTEATNLSNGAWSGDGSVLNPYTFTPLANDANVGASDIQTKLGTGAGNVKILTSLTNGQGNQTGTIIINAPITYTNAGNITKTFYITANSNVVVYKNIELKASTHSSGNANKVVNLELNSITKDVVLQASLLSSANYAINLSINDTASNGGNISLKSDAGKIRIYSNGVIESKGGNASSTTAIGGNGGNVILDGYNGVSIFGSIDLSNGFFGNSLTNANLFKAFPGSLTIINQDNGLFDLQAVNSIKVGNITKDGAGNFGITNTKWGGYVAPSVSALNAYTPQIKIINGNLILNSTTSIQDSADIEIQSNGKLDLNAKGETVGSISGAGQIINSSSTNAILTLNYFNSEKLTTTFSGSIKNNISIDKKGSSRKLILSGDNSYSGTTTVSNGTLNIQSENALGTFTGASDNTTVVNAATLELESGKSFNAESITFNAGASLINVSGQNILNGPLTNLGTATFTCSADSLEIENSTLALGGLLTINGNARISSVISGAGGITKSGASSTLILNGNNTYQGTTTINSGSVVKVGHNNALGQFNMTTFTSSHTQVATGGTLWVDGTGINISEETRVNGDGITTSGGVKLGAIYNQKGANKFTGKISLETDARIFSDGVSAAPTRDSLVFETVGIDLNNKILSFVTTSAIRNSRPILSSTTATGSIIKLGVDSLLLNAATESSYTGYTKVSEGGIVLGAANQINNASSLFLDGGYFNTGGYAETLGKLFLTNNSNLILGNTNHILTFASVDSLLNKKSLNIYGWLGDYTAATNEGTNGKILIQNSTLLPYQLDQINFIDIENSNAVNYSTQLITKYLIPKGDILSNPTYQSNIIINSEATDLTKGGWTGDGSSGNPWTFTPIANDANIQTTDIQAKLISGNNVIIKTTRASGGNQSGSIIIKDKISVDNTSLLSVGTLKLLAKRNITLYGNIEHTSTSTSTIIRPVPSIEFISDSGDINLYAAIKTTPKDIGYSAGQAANGGNISLNAIATTGTEGRIFIESNTLAFIEAKGANNTSAGASTKGGNGGDITLNGISGVNIYSFINTANGYRNASASDFTLSKPGKLTVNTNSTVLSSRVNEGQTSTSNMYIGDFEKTGTGKFNIYSIRRSNAGASLPAIVDNESNFSISGGTVLLTSSNSISDSANIALSNTGILDLNGYDETVGTYSGTVNTSITSTPSLKTLTTKSINSIAIKAIFDGSLGNINFIKETGSTDTTVLTKNNLATYLGKTTIRAGAIILQNDNALGAYNTPATNNTEISGTGSVQLENNISVLEPFTIASTSSNGAIRNQNGKNNLQGLITLSGTASIITHNATTGLLNDSLFITGGINIGANALTLTPNNQGMRISNTAIYGTGTITKSGADTLVLQNANTYTGNTTVNAGKLIIKDKDALGNNGTTYAITTLSGGTVVLDMETSTIAEPFTFATGEGIATDGALKLIETSTGNTISGAMVVNGNATTRINTYAPLTLSSSVSFNSGAILKLGGTGTITMTSLLSSVAATNGTLQQENPLLVLSGNSSSYTGNFNNPNTGNTTSLQNANGLGGTVVGSSGTATIGTGALLKIDGTGYSIAKALNLNGTGISNSGVIWNTGTSNTFAGAVTLAANSTINADASTTLTMSGVIGGTGFGITKKGTGTLSFGGTNTFTGDNLISEGIVVVTNINGLGGSGVGTSGTTTVSDGAMVKISVTGIVPEAFNITGTGVSTNGVIQNTVTGTNISGIITLAGNSTINTDASTTLTISGAIGGTGFGITKIGSGNLSLGGTNTFTGDNTISAGKAIVTNASGLGGSVVGSSGTTTVSNNAMVQFLTTGSMSVPEAFNIIGTGISNVGVLQNSVNGTNLTGAITLAGLSMIRTDASTTLTISNTTDGLGMDVNELNIGGAGTITFSGKLTGSNSTTSIFRKDGTGTLTLSNDNGTSFTGPIIVNAGGGILAATHANALGTTAAGTTVFNQSSLQLGVTSIAEPVNIRGHGYGKTSTDGTIGALFASDNFTYSGLLTVDSTATLSSATASKVLTIDAPGSIVMNDKVLNINGAGNFIINSTIAGSTTLNKWGIGTTTLSGDNGSSYTGPIVVNAGSGILLANHVNALGSTGAGTTVYNQGSLQIAVTDIAEPINIRGHGYGQTSTVATIGAFYASDSYTYKGVLTMDSTATIASVTAAKMLTLDNTTSAIVSNNTAGGTGYTINGAGDVSITGKLTGIGSLTKSGTGTTTLSYDNSTGTAYDAVTNVIDGILRITDGKALGTSTSTKHTVVSGTGSVQLENNITVLEPFTISSTNTNGAIRNQSGKNTLQGIITLNAAGTSKIVSAGIDNINDSLFIITGGINTGSLATTYVGLETLKGMRITATISGSGGFTKSGADTLLLYNTNGNTFTGIATLSDGIVRINNKSALGDSANTITTNYTQINSGATLFIDFKDVVLKESFIINGIGEIISGDTLGPIKTREGRNYLSGTIKVNSNSFINTGIDFVKNINTDSLIFNLINTDSELTIKTNIGSRVIGGISGNGSIVKVGMDTLIYTGANTYKGYTKISEGCLLLGATNIMPNTNSGNELIFNGGTLSSGGKENNFGRLSITENSKINLRFIDVHKLTFATGGSYTSGKKVVIYGWSGLTGGVVTPAGKIESTNVLQLSVYLRSSGKTDKSKSGGVQASGQVVSTALGVDFNGRIYMNSSPQLTQFQRDRIRFYYDKNEIEYSATQAAGGELLAENPIAIEPSTAFVGSTLTTTSISSPTNTTAVSGGNITAALNDSVLVRGVVWSTSTNPTVDLLTKTINGSGKGSFTSNLSGLTAGTTYYVRAYATNSNSTDYGSQVSFTTLRAPTVAATSAPSSFTYYTADMTGNISTDNGITITARGFVYAPASTTTSPTLANTVVTVSGTTVGSYTGTITGLTENTTYYVSSYATNSNGTTYGTPISFTSAIAPLGSGVSSRTASTSAYAIKVAFPNSTDGFYWIQNPNINGNVPVQIYADMTTDGGGWTLIMKNSNVSGWNSTNALLLNNTTMPFTTKADVESTTTVNYSIINWADYIKRNNSSAPFFQYMFDANARGRFGGIFNANVNYSFVSSSNGNTSVALATKFGTWSYDDSSIEQRMPYYTSVAGGGLITTSASYNGSWWGTLISNSGFGPAPWIGAAGGTEGTMTDPGIIWYWVR